MNYATAARQLRQPISQPLSYNPLDAHRKLFRQRPRLDSKDSSGVFQRLGIELTATANGGAGVVHGKAFHAAFAHVVNVIGHRHADVDFVHGKVAALGGATASGTLLLATKAGHLSEHPVATEFALGISMHFTAEGQPCDAAAPEGFHITCKPAFDLTNTGWTKVVLENVPFQCFTKGLIGTLLKASPYYQHVAVAGEFAGSTDLHDCIAHNIVKNTVVAFVVPPMHDRRLLHLPPVIHAWDGVEVTVRTSFVASVLPAVPPPPPGPPPVRATTHHTTPTRAQVGPAPSITNAPSPMEDVHFTGPSPMELEQVGVSLTTVQATVQVALSCHDHYATTEEAVLVEQQDEACHLWLQENGLGEEAGDCDITQTMRKEAIASVRAQHASIMHSITGTVPPAPLRKLLQSALRQVFDNSFTPVGNAPRGRGRQPAPPQARSTGTNRTHARNDASAHTQRIGSGQGLARSRPKGRVEGSQRDTGRSGPAARAARSLSPVQGPRVPGQAPYVTRGGRVVPPPGSCSLVRGAPMPPA